MLPLSLLVWQTVCQIEEIPDDVRRYLIIHFILPFEKAEYESLLINEIYDELGKEESDGLFCIEEDTIALCTPKVEALLHNKRIELDTRVKWQNQRIKRYVTLIDATCRHFNSTHLPVYKKGLEIGDMHAFELLYGYSALPYCRDDKLVNACVEMVSQRLVALSKWTPREIGYIHLLTRYCLDVKWDTIIVRFLDAALTMGIRVYWENNYMGASFVEIASKEQVSRFCAIYNEFGQHTLR